MAIVQAVEDGKIVDTSASSLSSSSSSDKSGSTLDKEAFLQLLVAQMKYQDPLSPTDNTQYVAQLATFSQLEETQNQTDVLEGQTADSLVGKQVMVSVRNAVTGETTTDTGKVDCVIRENGKIYLSINENLYNFDDVSYVIDDSYLDAVNLAQSFKTVMGLLPNANQCKLTDKTSIESAQEIYNSMTSYQQQYVDEEDLTKLKNLVAKLAELEKLAGTTPGTSESGDSTSGDDTTDSKS